MALASLILTTSCTGGAGDLLLGALIYKNLIKKGGSERIWTGRVRTSGGQLLADCLVTVTAQRPAPLEDVSRSDLSDDSGMYRLSMPWFEVATYSIEINYESMVVYHEDVGPVANEDQSRDVVVSETLSVAVSGIAKDPAGNPVEQVLVSVARAGTIGGNPDALITDEGGSVRYQITNPSGIFLFDAVFGRPLLVVGFNPELGFGYLYLENPTQESGGDLLMPSGSTVSVEIRVLNAAGEPMADAVLPVAQRFVARLEPAYDLSSQLGALVADEGLFGGRSAQEIAALHPVAGTAEIQSTGADGIADQSCTLKSGLYTVILEDTSGNAYDGALVGLATRMVDEGSATIEVKIPAS